MNERLPAELSKAFASHIASRFMREVFSVSRFAHHPGCKCFDAHVLRFKALTLCLGCTCLAVGAAIGTTTAWAMYLAQAMPFGWLGTIVFVISGVALYLPTLLQPFHQHKPFKVLARTLLGVAIVLLWVGGFVLAPMDFLGVAARLAFMLVFIAVYRATLRQRAKYTPDPCRQCEPATFPFCKDNQPRIDALVAELRKVAAPEETAFLAFAAALAGEASPHDIVEVLQMRSTVPTTTGGCHSRRRAIGNFPDFLPKADIS